MGGPGNLQYKVEIEDGILKTSIPLLNDPDFKDVRITLDMSHKPYSPRLENYFKIYNGRKTEYLEGEEYIKHENLEGLPCLVVWEPKSHNPHHRIFSKGNDLIIHEAFEEIIKEALKIEFKIINYF